MQGNQLGIRTQLDYEYAADLGAALYVFATLEHNVRWLGESVLVGFGNWTTMKTAGQIAERFVALIRKSILLDVSLRETVSQVASEFLALVLERNALMHGIPCTASDSAQRLNDNVHGFGLWTPLAVQDFSRRCETTSIAANALLHGPFVEIRESTHKAAPDKT